MSASLAEKIRIARHKSVEIKGITFNYTRPTDMQMAELNQEFGDQYMKPEIARRFVFGWSGVTEADLILGADATPVDFEKDAFFEWLNDSRDFWTPLYEAIRGAYVDYASDI